MKVPIVSSLPHALSRRDFIRAGTLGAASLLLPQALFAENQGVTLNANHRVVEVGSNQRPIVVIWLSGGLSHIDTFTPLPQAPENIRGPFGSIQSSVPGIPISEKMPLMANQLRYVALLRNIHHTQGDHRLATHRMFTGSDTEGVNQKPRFEPHIVKLGEHLNKNNLGYVIFSTDSNIYKSLGPDEALLVQRNYNSETKSYEYRSPLGGLFDRTQHRGRRELLSQINRGDLSGGPITRWEELSDRANSMLDGDLNNAFDLSRVPDRELDRYGRTDFGRAAIIAKRMIDAGAPLILIQKGGWDNHDYLVDRLNENLPDLDRVLSRLIEDLKDRAIIVVASEFGRTPRMNEGFQNEYGSDKRTPPGRDHWPGSNFMIVAGPGIEPKIVGRLDNSGEIASDRYNAALMGPTILRAAGYELREDRNGALSAESVPYYPIFGS